MGGDGGGEKLGAFLRWATEAGISDEPSPCSSPPPSSCLGQSLVLSHFPDAGGRGLAAARDLEKGERVLRVPKAALLTSESVLADETLAAGVKRRPQLSAAQILIACLLAEVGKGRSSRWYLYLMQLPQSYDTLSSFTQFEIKSLQVEDAIWASEKIPAKVHSEWEETVSLMQEIGMKPRLRTFRSWLWASATISSRALHVPWDEAGCLCPVGDFFNYAAPGDESSSEDADEETSAEGAAWNSEASLHQRLADGGYEEDEAAYCFYARRRYNKGEQVLLCYGTYTNLELLEHYGFLLSLNPNDKAFIPLDPGMKTSSTWPRDAAYVQGDGRPSFALLSTLRLRATPHHLRRMVGHRAYSGLQLSVENEASVMKWLTNKCQAVLDELPTGPAEDSSTMGMVDRMQECSSWEDCVGLVQSSGGEIREFLLANGLEEDGVAGSPLPGKVKRSMRRFRLALQWRLHYKKALLQCISYCRDTIDTISSQRR